jgi:tRNA A37 threonylcarbamoyltransferase TsaD
LNSRLRSKLAGMCADLNVNLLMPKASYCTDNAAMIAAASELDESLTPSDPAVLDANPNRSFDD